MRGELRRRRGGASYGDDDEERATTTEERVLGFFGLVLPFWYRGSVLGFFFFFFDKHSISFGLFCFCSVLYRLYRVLGIGFFCSDVTGGTVGKFDV